MSAIITQKIVKRATRVSNRLLGIRLLQKFSNSFLCKFDFIDQNARIETENLHLSYVLKRAIQYRIWSLNEQIQSPEASQSPSLSIISEARTTTPPSSNLTTPKLSIITPKFSDESQTNSCALIHLKINGAYKIPK